MTPNPAVAATSQHDSRGSLLGVASWVAIALGVTVLLLQVLLPVDSRGNAYAALWGRLPILAIACWVGWRAARANATQPRAAHAWKLMTAAMAVLVLADLYGGWLVLIRGVSLDASAADVLYLSYFPLILGGLLVLPRGFAGRLDFEKFALDAAIVTLCGGLVAWEYGIRPALEAAQNTAQLLLDLSYPLGDLSTLLAISTLLLRVPHDSSRVPLLFIASVLAISLAGDAAWLIAGLPGRAGLKPVAYALWTVQPVFFVVAAELERRRVRDDRAQRAWKPGFVALPILALVLCYAMLADVAFNEPSHLAALFPGAALLTALVVLRQHVAQRENAALVAERARRASEARFAALVERASDAILIVDPALQIVYASPAARRLTGGESGGSLARFLVPEDADALASFATACLRAPIERVTFALRFGRGGPPIETETSVTNLLADPEVRGLVLNVRDVSERRALEAALREHRLHDPLTGLANRELFLDRLGGAIVRTEAAGTSCALVVFDLDRFKLVNDGLGNRVGDQLLASVASRLLAVANRTDIVARLGGDEFGVVLEDAQHAESVRERVERLRAGIAEPLRIDQHALRITASAGLAFSPPGSTAADLLRNADIALQQARAEGGDTTEMFRGERHGRILERLALEAEVPALLARDAFGVAFEPCVTTVDGRPSGLVVRAEWREPQSLPVATIVAAIRESSTGVELARRVRQLAERDLAALARFVPDADALSVLLPLEPGELRQNALAPQLREFAQRAGVPLARVVLVVDEAAIATLSGRALDALTRVRQEGARLALGGFGAALDAFELLDAYHFDMLVLSETVVARVDAGERPATLLRAAIATGRSLGLEVLAPGVASARQLALLGELGCEYAAGSAIAPPLSYERLLPWMGARLREREAV